VAVARSEELRALAQRVADALPPDVIEVVVTGSVSRGVADDVSDIEMLCVTERPLSLEEAFELARRAGLEERESWGRPVHPDAARLRLPRRAAGRDDLVVAGARGGALRR